MLALRRPEWADEIGAHAKWPIELMPVEDGYLGVKRVWSPGDTVDVTYKFGMRTRAEANGRTSYWVGPWLLGASAADNPAYFNELTTENRLLSEAVTDQKFNSGGLLAVPVARAAFGYRQAEYPDQPGIVQLRAIAEQTGQPTTSWEMRFLTKDRG